MSAEVKDFIKKCLSRDPNYRLGITGPQEILTHPWFAEMDKEAILNK